MENLSEIIERLTPHDIYGSDFKNTSGGFKMLCPFHEEKTASFVIRSKDLGFHCFGCNCGGSAFDFVMKKDGLPFPEAVRVLAEKAGVQLPKGNGHGRTGRLFELNKTAAEFFQFCLKKNSRVMDYLTLERGLTPESIERFQIGCTNGQAVSDVLTGRGFSRDEIVEAGIGYEKDDGLKDYFWERIMFPITLGGKIRGFGGRVIGAPKDDTPKFKNSPATVIFNKRALLYGLDPMAIKEAGYAIVVEGYLDVIMSHQYGFRNTVAPLGTAFSPEQLELLSKYTNTIYTVFDGDGAGMRAANATAKLMFDERTSGGVVILPDGEDPDSFLRGGGSLEDLIYGAMPFSVFLSTSPHNRKMIFNKLLMRGSLETVEFLSHMRTPEELKAYEEMSCRSLVLEMFLDAALLIRRDTIEIRRRNGIVLLISRKRIVFWEREGRDLIKQAEAMMKRFNELKKKAAKTKVKTQSKP